MDETFCSMRTLIIVELNIFSHQKYILHCDITNSTWVKDLSSYSTTGVRLCGVGAYYLHETRTSPILLPLHWCHESDVSITFGGQLHLSNNVSSKKWFFFLTLSLSSSPCLGSCLHPSHILLRLFRYRKWFSVSDRDTVLRRCNPSPVLPFVPWGYMEYEPKDAQPTSHTQRHTKKSHPSSSISLSPALTSHLNSKVRLFISLPHPIRSTLYKRMKSSLSSCSGRIRAEVETAVSHVLQPYNSLSRRTDSVRYPANQPARNYRCSN